MGDRLAGEARVLELERELASCRAHAEALQISADQAAEVRPLAWWRRGWLDGPCVVHGVWDNNVMLLRERVDKGRAGTGRVVACCVCAAYLCHQRAQGVVRNG